VNEQEALQAATAALNVTSANAIARGGQKVVYEAVGPTGEPVILKVVQILGARDPNALERCQREVELLREFDSEHIVRVISEIALLGPAPDAAAWLEERLDGEDLNQLLGSPWNWDDVSNLLIGISSGLAAMHDSGYVHRDLSAGNVRRTAAEVWKVMDPGFAKHLNRTSITGPWQPGTPGYLSPEHVSLGGRVTPASDVFCLGVLAYQALTGQLPIAVSPDLMEYRNRLMSTSAPSIASARSDLDLACVRIIDCCLERQPARRYLDANELLEALQALRDGTNS